MRRYVLAYVSVALLLQISGALALTPCSSYAVLSNGNTADATAVMANFDCAALTSGSTINNLTLTGTTSFPGSTIIDSTGFLGLGMVPSNILDITQNKNGNTITSLLNPNGGSSAQTFYQASNGTDVAQMGVEGAGYSGGSFWQAHYGFVFGGAGLIISTGGTGPGPIKFGINSNEAGRVGSDGSLVWGTTANGGVWGDSKFESVADGVTSRFAVSGYASGSVGKAFIARVASTTDDLMGFYYGATAVGFITTNGTNTTYSTSSDERLKAWNVKQRDYRAAIRSIWVGDFQWKKTGKADFGYRAQQLHAVYPEAVHVGGADPQKQPWSVDYGKTAPLALWGVKDLYRESEAQKHRIAELEGKLAAQTARQNKLEARLAELELRSIQTARN